MRRKDCAPCSRHGPLEIIFRQRLPQRSPGSAPRCSSGSSRSSARSAFREWWLLGRDVPEARQVAEVASLLAVARGELEQALHEQFDWRLPMSNADAAEQEEADELELMGNPAWIQARRDEANGLVRMLRQNLPGMRTFAEQLRANAADAGMPATALGALGIVQDRLGEAIEALRENDV